MRSAAVFFAAAKAPRRVRTLGVERVDEVRIGGPDAGLHGSLVQVDQAVAEFDRGGREQHQHETQREQPDLERQ
jgi:hypothetical protein